MIRSLSQWTMVRSLRDGMNHGTINLSADITDVWLISVIGMLRSFACSVLDLTLSNINPLVYDIVHICNGLYKAEYMYVEYSRVHICTQPNTTRYIYVLCRICTQSYMYSVVYDLLHICTLSIRLDTCVYLFGVHLVG